MGFPIDANLQDIDLDPVLNSTPGSKAKAGETEPRQRELAFGSSDPTPTPTPTPTSTPTSTSTSRPESAPESAPEGSSTSPRRVRGGCSEDDDRSPLLRKAARWIAVAGGCGYVPLAPGTAGSAAGALLFLILYGVGSGAPWMPLLGDPLVSDPAEAFQAEAVMLGPVGLVIFLTILIGVLTVVGIWASAWAEQEFRREGGDKDDGRIVIDEVVGQLIALAPLPLILGRDSSFLSVATAVVTGFVLFRLFDVWKPGAVRWAENRFDGGLGVMADDLIAGVYAAGVLTALVLFVTADGFHLAERLAMGRGLLAGRGLS